MDEKLTAFFSAYKDLIEADRAERSVELVNLIEPSEAVVNALAAAGCVMVAKGYDEWCHNDTCAHNSHDAGQSWQKWEIPSAWLVANGERETSWELRDFVTSEVYKLDDNDETVIAILPDLSAIYSRSHGQGFSDTTRLAQFGGNDATAQAARDLAAKRIGFGEFKRIVRDNS